LIVAGVWHLRRREAHGEPVGISAAQWAGIVLGAVVIIISFMMDCRNLKAGGMPHPFNWIVFSAGLLIGVGSYAWAAHAAGKVVAAMRSADAGR
jgi:hypothetical protein